MWIWINISAQTSISKSALLHSGHLHSVVSTVLCSICQENDTGWPKVTLLFSCHLICFVVVFSSCIHKAAFTSSCQNDKSRHERKILLKKKKVYCSFPFWLFGSFCCRQSSVLRRKIPQVTQHALAGHINMQDRLLLSVLIT